MLVHFLIVLVAGALYDSGPLIVAARSNNRIQLTRRYGRIYFNKTDEGTKVIENAKLSRYDAIRSLSLVYSGDSIRLNFTFDLETTVVIYRETADFKNYVPIARVTNQWNVNKQRILTSQTRHVFDESYLGCRQTSTTLDNVLESINFKTRVIKLGTLVRGITFDLLTDDPNFRSFWSEGVFRSDGIDERAQADDGFRTQCPGLKSRAETASLAMTLRRDGTADLNQNDLIVFLHLENYNQVGDVYAYLLQRYGQLTLENIAQASRLKCKGKLPECQPFYRDDGQFECGWPRWWKCGSGRLVDDLHDGNSVFPGKIFPTSPRHLKMASTRSPIQLCDYDGGKGRLEYYEDDDKALVVKEWPSWQIIDNNVDRTYRCSPSNSSNIYEFHVARTDHFVKTCTFASFATIKTDGRLENIVIGSCLLVDNAVDSVTEREWPLVQAFVVWISDQRRQRIHVSSTASSFPTSLHFRASVVIPIVGNLVPSTNNQYLFKIEMLFYFQSDEVVVLYDSPVFQFFQTIS